MVTPNGAPWVPRLWVDNAMGKSARSGVPVAEDVGRLHATLEDLAKSKGIGKTYVSRTATRHRGSARAVEPAQGLDDLHLKA